MTESDWDIIIRCRRGDRKAQMQLYTTYYKKLYNSCFRILRNSYDAEDAMQESFMKIFAHLEKYKKEIPFEAWIIRITINTAIDKLRKKELEIVDLNENYHTLDEDPEEEYGWEDMDEKIELIKKSIELLPENCRLILTLYLFEGYDHEEIAEILKIQPGTCRIQYMRAKKKLVELVKSA